MMEWWISRAPRERLLIGLAGVLFVSVLAIQLLFVPLANARENAALQNAASSKALDTVTAGLARLSSEGGATVTGGQALAGDAARTAIVDLARRRGLNVTRVGNASSGAVTVAIDSAAPQLIFAWLTDLKAQHGIQPQQVNMNADGAGLVAASLTFQGEAGR